MALACCAVEVAVGLQPMDDDEGNEPVDGDVLLVAGTVTAAALPIVVARFHELAEPRYVVAYGACATSGGPYWDSYAVIPGIGDVLNVDVVVPGCPPSPEFVGTALVTLARSLNAEAKHA